MLQATTKSMKETLGLDTEPIAVFVLTSVHDTGAKKVPLSHDLDAGPKAVDEYVLRSDVDAMKHLIRTAIEQT